MMCISKTGEFDVGCEHEWQPLSKEDREKYGETVARCLESWEECRKCNQVRYVGSSPRPVGEHCGNWSPDHSLPALTPLYEIDNLEDLLGQGRR